MNWIHVEDRLPSSKKKCLISDGKNISIGYYEEVAEFTFNLWTDIFLKLNTDDRYIPEIKFWSEISDIPEE